MHVENFTSFHSVKKSAKSVKNFIFYDQNRSRGTITSSYYVTRMVVKNVVSNEFSGYIMVPLQKHAHWSTITSSYCVARIVVKNVVFNLIPLRRIS